MVIDDDAMVLESLEAILTEWGYEALTATGAEQAVARAPGVGSPAGHRDRRLPAAGGRTGTEAILAVRALFDHPIPGLILTGETDLKFLRECPGTTSASRTSR